MKQETRDGAIMDATKNHKTDGPWIVGRTLPNMLVLVTNRCGLGVAEVMRDDAALVAAAPELLAAAQNALNVLAALAIGDLKAIKTDSAAIAELRAAILRAEGK